MATAAVSKLFVTEDEELDDDFRRFLAAAKIDDSLSEPPFTHVTKLDLSGCHLSALPLNFAELFPELSVLFLSNNHFEELPAVLGDCLKLQMVAFKNNQMQRIHPDALQSQLRWLILTDNSITEIPETIGRCVQLQKLMLAGNQIQQLPKAISKCKQLELVRLSSNLLKEPPTELLRLENLKWVALSDNPFLQSLFTRQQQETILPVIHDIEIQEETSEILGQGAGGITRKVFFKDEWVAVKSFHNDTITSDGSPDQERLLFAAASALCPKSIVRVLGQTAEQGSVVMEYLENYQALAQPPSLQTCSRDVYDKEAMYLTESQATTLLADLLEAQVCLKSGPVVSICHGDFYGHNILVNIPVSSEATSNISVKLSDFGAAFFYDKTAEWGRLLELCELRAYGVLVQEVLALVEDGENNDSDNDEVQDESPSLLKQLAEHCKIGTCLSFDSLSIWWKQQQLKNLAKSLHNELMFA
jgi:hypothetical protein